MIREGGQRCGKVLALPGGGSPTRPRVTGWLSAQT